MEENCLRGPIGAQACNLRPLRKQLRSSKPCRLLEDQDSIQVNHTPQIGLGFTAGFGV